MKRPPLVTVTWDDAVAEVNDSVLLSDVTETLIKDQFPLAIGRRSVGYLVWNDNDIVVLFTDFDATPEAEYSSRTTIPKGWVTQIRVGERGKILYKKEKPCPDPTTTASAPPEVTSGAKLTTNASKE